MNLSIYIERLILDGIEIPRWQCSHLQAAFEAELTRLLIHGESVHELQTGGTRPYVGVTEIELSREDEPGIIGQRIAQAFYRGIRQ